MNWGVQCTTGLVLARLGCPPGFWRIVRPTRGGSSPRFPFRFVFCLAYFSCCFLAPDYASPMFWMSNIGLMLSANKLMHPSLEYLGAESSVHLYKVLARMGEAWQATLQPPDMTAKSVTITDPVI